MSPAPNPLPSAAGTVVFGTSTAWTGDCPSPPDRGFTQSGCQASTATAVLALGVLGVGLFGNAAQSGW